MRRLASDLSRYPVPCARGAIRPPLRAFCRPLSRAGPPRRLRQLIPPTGLDPLLGPDTAAFREYIVKSVEQRSYTQGTQTASITLYRLRDPSSAYGAYTFLRNDSLSAADLGSYASASQRPRANRRRGNAARCFGAGKAGASFGCRLEATCRSAGQEGGSHAVSVYRRASSRKGTRAQFGALRDRSAQPGAFRSARNGRLDGLRPQRGNDPGPLPGRREGRDAAHHVLSHAAGRRGRIRGHPAAVRL